MCFTFAPRLEQRVEAIARISATRPRHPGTAEASQAFERGRLQNGAVSQRVLVVDDEPIVREVLGRYLARDGFAVDTAGNGEAALDSFDATPPDIAVLDLMLPRLDGTEVFTRTAGSG